MDQQHYWIDIGYNTHVRSDAITAIVDLLPSPYDNRPMRASVYTISGEIHQSSYSAVHILALLQKIGAVLL